jgi:hypothetical protein
MISSCWVAMISMGERNGLDACSDFNHQVRAPAWRTKEKRRPGEFEPALCVRNNYLQARLVKHEWKKVQVTTR